jgi:hypothetical protein
MEKKSKNPRIMSMPVIDYEIPWCFFTKHVKVTPPPPPNLQSGCGFFLNHKHYILIIYSPRTSTNKRVEFIALWMSLEATKKNDINKLHVMGNSNMVIHWEFHNASMTDVTTFPHDV